MQRLAGIRLGRCSLVPENDPHFGLTEEEVARYWCERSGIPIWEKPTSDTMRKTRWSRSELGRGSMIA
jgi:hypothetical protein